jgi:hypothetical protein
LSIVKAGFASVSSTQVRSVILSIVAARFSSFPLLLDGRHGAKNLSFSLFAIQV